MTYKKFEFQPGIIADDTDLKSETRWIAGNRARFRDNLPEVIGGWQKAHTPAIGSPSFTGIARGAFAWTDNAGAPYLAWGTAANLYTMNGGAVSAVTGNRDEGVLTNPFSTVSGSTTVTVAHTAHGAKVGDPVTFSHATAVGGLTLNGTFAITAVTDANTYTFTAGSAATSSAGGGGKVSYVYAFPGGLVDGTGGFGYGTGPYGSGPYGKPNIGDYLPLSWSLSNFGADLIAVPLNGGVYVWQAGSSYSTALTNGDFSSTTAGWATGTGWFIGGGVASASAGVSSNLSQNITGLIKAGRVARLTFDLTATAGTLQPYIDTLAIGSPISVSGNYSLLVTIPTGASNLLFTKDATFAGTIDNVSLSIEAMAYRITSAPARCVGGFVTPERTVVTYGATQFNGDYNPLCVRWSAQENNRQWTPDPTNVSGEYYLGNGGHCVGGLASRQSHFIWTDTALFSMQFAGNTSTVYSFNLLGSGCGLMGKLAAAEYGGMVFWAANNRNFYVYRGSVPEIIPCTVKREFFDNLPDNQTGKVVCGINAAFNEVWWLYPDSREGNEVSRAVVFNWKDGTWMTHVFPRSSWVDQGVFVRPIGLGTDGLIYYHEIGVAADGNPINASLSSGFFDADDGEELSALMGYRPDFRSQVGAITMTLTGRGLPSAADVTKGPFTILPTTSKVDFRFQARQLKIGFTFANSARLGTLPFDIEGMGARR